MPNDVARTTPTGTQLENGFGIKIALQNIPGAAFWEVEVQPPTVKVGGPVVQSNMWNVDYETKAPGALIDLGEAKVTAHYDPVLMDAILAQCGVEQFVTILFPGGAKETFGGYIQDWGRASLQKDNKPTCTFTVVSTGRNPTTKAELAPDYVAPA